MRNSPADLTYLLFRCRFPTLRVPFSPCVSCSYFWLLSAQPWLGQIFYSSCLMTMPLRPLAHMVRGSRNTVPPPLLTGWQLRACGLPMSAAITPSAHPVGQPFLPANTVTRMGCPVLMVPLVRIHRRWRPNCKRSDTKRLSSGSGI